MKAGRSRFAESNPGRQWMKAGESRFAESNPGRQWMKAEKAASRKATRAA
ncbi:MAG TPA: hypothetical protein PL067_06325 [Bacteroidales bacterium]|nr:hypothetical protein [Bacteroidales bacterium]HPO40320.1 hypothetical protein [Bacteroidales bacterium]